MRVTAAATTSAAAPESCGRSASSASQLSRISLVASAVCSTTASSSSVAAGIWLWLMSSTRSAAISDLARLTSRPSASSSESSAASPTVMAPESVPRTARTAASIRSWPGPSCRMLPSGMRHHLLDLLAQRLRVEGLDDVVGDAGLLGGHHVLGLALGGDHDEGQFLQPRIGPHFLQQVEPGHRLHVPVGDHQPEAAGAQLGQRLLPVGGFLDIVEFKL